MSACPRITPFLLVTAVCFVGLSSSAASPTVTSADAVFVGAGDIAGCNSLAGAESVAQLLDSITGAVFTAGDNSNDLGTAAQYTDCYGPTWGRHLARTSPAPGNHDYLTNATNYYDYFGAGAHGPNGYYSYDLGAWHIVALNGNCSEVGGCGAGSLQEQWLRADLASHATACALAYWHQPRFSSGSLHGSDATYSAFWQALYDYHADVVINGHDHDYERFAPQDPNGNADPVRGIREFVVGTGGAGTRTTLKPFLPTTQVRNDDTLGVIKLTLHPTSYEWEFVPIFGGTFTDGGSEACRTSESAPVGGILEYPQLEPRPVPARGPSGPNAAALVGLAAGAILLLAAAGWYARRRSLS